jgi:hypothetical protein
MRLMMVGRGSRHGAATARRMAYDCRCVNGIPGGRGGSEVPGLVDLRRATRRRSGIPPYLENVHNLDDDIGSTCSNALWKGVASTAAFSNFVVAVPNTKLRIAAERPRTPDRPSCNLPVAIDRQTT